MGVFVDEYCPHGAPVLSTMGLWGTLLGFIGYTPQFGCLGRLGYTGGTPHTYKTNPAAMWGCMWAQPTPLMPLCPALPPPIAPCFLFVAPKCYNAPAL